MKGRIIKWGYSNKNSIIAFIIGLVFSYIVFSILGYLYQIYILDNSNYIISKNAVYFRVDQNTSGGSVDFSFLESFSGIDSINIFKDRNGSQTLYECLIMNCYSPPNQGRGFAADDFINNKHTAYVGYKAGEIYDLSNLIIGNYSYDIIGHYSSETPSLNYAIFYTDGSLYKVSTHDAFIIDGKNRKTTKGAFNFIKQNLKAKGIDVYSFDPDISCISDFLSYRGKVVVAGSLLLLLLMFSNIATAMFWIISNGDYIRISNILGVPGAKSYLLRKILFILFASSLLGYGLIMAFKEISLPLFITTVSIIFIVLSTLCSFIAAEKITGFDSIMMENDYEDY